MTTLARRAAVAGALLCLAIGVYQAVLIPPRDRRFPAAARLLAGLEQAPLERGAPVALLAPPATIVERKDALLFEATWLRPDVRWAFLDRWPAPLPPATLVVPALADVPHGWREVWRHGSLAVCARSER